MKKTENKTLKERFEEINKIPEGFHDDFDGIWETLEPEMEELNTTLAPRPKRRLYWLYAAAAAVALLVIGVLAGSLWQSNRDNRFLEIALRLKQPEAHSATPRDTVIIVKTTGAETGMAVITRQPDQVNSQIKTVSAPPRVNPAAAGSKKEKTAGQTIIPGTHTDSITKQLLPAPGPMPNDVALSILPGHEKAMTIRYRNRPGKADIPAVQAQPVNMGTYAFGVTFLTFRSN